MEKMIEQKKKMSLTPLGAAPPGVCAFFRIICQRADMRGTIPYLLVRLSLAGVLSLVACSPGTSMSTYKGAPDFARLQPSSIPFDQEAAKRLTPERRRQLDIEFFNQFWYKSEGPETVDRIRRVRAVAEEGFETAYLAEQLYNFKSLGLPWFRSDYQPHWERLKVLAAAGDASAQCLFSYVSWNYREFSLDPPTKYDQEVLGPRYMKAAAEQGQPYCMIVQAGKDYPHGQEKSLQRDIRCAYLGATICQDGMAARYLSGRGVPADKVKALCWGYKAKSNNSAPSIESFFRSLQSAVRETAGQGRLDRVLEVLTPNVDCDTVSEALLNPNK